MLTDPLGHKSPGRCSSDELSAPVQPGLGGEGESLSAGPVVPPFPGFDAAMSLVTTLSAAGFVAADEEAAELIAASGDAADLEGLLARRLAGEPLAWIVGRAQFAGLDIAVQSGVYVPRWQSTELARRAAVRLPGEGVAADLCTGSGALALALMAARPESRVVASDTDARAVTNARANGVEAYLGDLFAPLPPELGNTVDVVVAVVPYVPTGALELLPHDTLTFEDRSHYDGGPTGTDLLLRVAEAAPSWLRAGGWLLLELGGEQADVVAPALAQLGYALVETWEDDEGDLRGIQAQFG
jgi:release factor glutamine methyltransferase